MSLDSGGLDHVNGTRSPIFRCVPDPIKIRRTLAASGPFPRVVGSFGDSPEMATELADLVIAGIKRATVSLARDYNARRQPTPRPGDFAMMLDGEGLPRFIWRTTEITIKPLSEVDEAFAWDEGEGDRTRDWWLAAHRRYFGQQASREGFEFDDNIRRFEIVWPLTGSPSG